MSDASIVCMSYTLHFLMKIKIERNSLYQAPMWGIGRREKLASPTRKARYMGEKERKELVDIRLEMIQMSASKADRTA